MGLCKLFPILFIGIRFLLDFVPNHTSNQHEWFIKSVQRIEPYTDYYVWKYPKYVNGTRQVPNNWVRKNRLFKLCTVYRYVIFVFIIIKPRYI